MEEKVTEEKIDEFLRFAKPIRDFRNWDQHRENPNNLPACTVRIDLQGPLTFGTPRRSEMTPQRRVSRRWASAPRCSG
jgi:hypothetical protein